MAKYKIEDTDPKVLADEVDDSPEQVGAKAALAKFSLEDQKPEFQSAYADYKARMSKQGSAAVAGPDEYYKILSALAHAHKFAKSQGQPAAKGGAMPRTPATQNVMDQAASSGVDLSRYQDKR
jgi:hypothetical protein